MKCPVDKNDMLVVEYQQIELDYCPQCRGVWFDSGELDLLLPAMKPGKLESSPEAKSAETKRKCPLCGKKMRQSTMGQDPGVLIDICPRGEGLWFDGGEVQQLVTALAKKTAASVDAYGRVLAFLGDVFQATK